MLPYTRQCLESLFRYTSYPYELIILDNGSSDGITWNYLQSLSPNTPFLQSLRLFQSQTNLGTAGAGNMVLGAASGDFLCCISNDVVFEPGWLNELIAFLETNPGAGAVCPYTLLSCSPEEYPERRRRYLAELGNHVSDAFLAAVFVLTRECFERVGYLDEQFQNSYDDVDYWCRLSRAGFSSKCLHRVVLYHYGYVTRRHLNDHLAENEQKFKKKYGLL